MAEELNQAQPTEEINDSPVEQKTKRQRVAQPSREAEQELISSLEREKQYLEKLRMLEQKSEQIEEKVEDVEQLKKQLKETMKKAQEQERLLRRETVPRQILSTFEKQGYTVSEEALKKIIAHAEAYIDDQEKYQEVLSDLIVVAAKPRNPNVSLTPPPVAGALSRETMQDMGNNELINIVQTSGPNSQYGREALSILRRRIATSSALRRFVRVNE